MPTSPFGPYYHIAPEFGFGKWPLTSITPRDSTCVGCHRIGVEHTCGELTGSTITITSLGALGGIVSTPVINAPETSIIGINKASRRIGTPNALTTIINHANACAQRRNPRSWTH